MNEGHRDSKGLYRLLGLTPEASEQQIQLAYEALLEAQPETWRGSKAEVDRAYSILRNSNARRLYDYEETAPVPGSSTVAARPARTKSRLDDVRVLAACFVLLVGILLFVWYPLYGNRLRSFSPGDRLVGLDGAAFGLVVQAEEMHVFPNGTAPAFLVEVAATGELRWYPASDIKAICRKAE